MKAIDKWERVSQDPEVLLAYEARRKALLDEKSALKRAETIEKRAVSKRYGSFFYTWQVSNFYHKEMKHVIPLFTVSFVSKS